MILLSDIFSVFHRSGKLVKYGNKGDPVRVISEHGDVLIVMGTHGSFPVRKDKIRQYETDSEKLTDQQSTAEKPRGKAA